jgi:MULE transposase domain
MYEVDKTALIAVCCCDFSLKWLLDFGEILYIDSSYKNKTANNAPLTNFVVVDPKSGCMCPAVCAITSDATIETYKTVFQAVKNAAATQNSL